METGDENASKRPKVDPSAAATAAAASCIRFMAEQNAIATAEIATAHSSPAVCIGGQTFSVRLIGGQR